MIYGEEEFDQTLIKIIKTSHTNFDGRTEGLEAYRHSCYKEACEHAEEMSWHLYGTTPDTLLERARPREDPEVTKYRKENYEATTKSAADKAINIVSKIFNPNLYSIRWKTETSSSKELKEYSLEYYPEYNSVVNFTKDVLLRKMLADPNAVAAVKIEDIPETTKQEVTTPKIVIYGSSCVWNYDYEHYLLFIRKEEERLENHEKAHWFYFDYFDTQFYREFRARITPQNQLIVEELKNYLHGFTEIPAWKLQGKSWSMDNGEIMYKSFFDSAVPYWNLSIVHESDVLGAYINHMHPLRVEVAEKCNYLFEGRYQCTRGVVVAEGGEKMSCPSCSGTGYKPSGPYGVMKIPRDKLADSEGNSISPAEAIQYVNIPVDATKMLEERADRMRQMGMWAINMDVEDEVGENQSGVAKVIDRSAQYDTLYNIGSVIFDVHLQNIFYFFNKYMFSVADVSAGKAPENNLPEINKPTQFDIASTTELINNYKAAKDSGLDPNFLQIKQIEIGTRDLTTNPDLKKFTNLLLDLDPLPGMDANTVSLNVSKFFIRQVDAVIHFNIKRFLERAIQEDKTFMEKPRTDQVAKLEEYGEAVVKETKPKLDPNILAYADQQKKQAKESAFAQGV
jgi:hypothetical protein